MMRQTFATTLQDNSNDLKTIHALMGHSHISTTETYFPSTDDTKVEAILMDIDIDDLLEFSADHVLKEFMRKDLIREGIDVDNWQRKSASVLSGAFGHIVGGLLGGPIGFLLGSLLWGVAQSATYDGDRSPDEVKEQYREACRIKAIERCMRIIADSAPTELHPRFRQAFYDAQDSYRGSEIGLDSYTLESTISDILASVDYETAGKFDRLYSAAKEVIG